MSVTPLQEPYLMVVLYEQGFHEVESLLLRPNHRLRIPVSNMSNALLTVECNLHTEAGPNSVNKHFLSRSWKESIKRIKVPLLRTANHNIVNVGDIVLLFAYIGDLRVCTWFGIVENLAVDFLLETSFINRCICGIFSTKKKSSLGIRGQWWLLQQNRNKLDWLWRKHVRQKHETLRRHSTRQTIFVSRCTTSFDTASYQRDSIGSLSSHRAQEDYDRQPYRWTLMFHNCTEPNGNSTWKFIFRLHQSWWQSQWFFQNLCVSILSDV